MRKSWLLIGVALLAAGLAIGAVACEEEDEDGEEPTATEAVETPSEGETPTAGETPQAGVVNVDLNEWTVSPDPASVSAGSVTFNAANIGTEDHELVIIKTDLAPEALPTKADGSVDEEGAGIQAIDEIEEFPEGEQQSLSLNLEPGAYVLICNLVEEHEGETMIHYAEGMYTAFPVTE